MKKKKRMHLTCIAGYLNSNGVKTRLHGRWHASTIKGILENPIYKGKLRFGGQLFNGTHERLV
ncbi:hypothetical protein A2642_01915 [Candidatus Nomurabacteria bacterium RIFCSPHIGHO2_01_FULL_39_10]|uniref:Recombinase domain-containing protein n=1 Tax=Candidatus Nomurabacteria bacterium RIFCSPHIGHO2_01_FULL_39_10 TaxID=1801733 RepID=A0A1F6VAW1_9BACT|nr:MAG: hypothetical protein A2642_01915 [Candidatus Nomurabacteria bacterium RIFCSPHIGHO2_01_FULL_39_10]